MDFQACLVHLKWEVYTWIHDVLCFKLHQLFKWFLLRSALRYLKKVPCICRGSHNWSQTYRLEWLPTTNQSIFKVPLQFGNSIQLNIFVFAKNITKFNICGYLHDVLCLCGMKASPTIIEFVFLVNLITVERKNIVLFNKLIRRWP